MKQSKYYLSLLILFFVGFTNSFADETTPLLSFDIKNYEALIEDVETLATVADEDASALEMQLAGMLGAEVFALIDKTAAWHIAVWMESMGQPPLVAIVLPIEDFEAFQTAVQTSMISALGIQFLDADDCVVLYGSSPGAPTVDGWAENVKSYAETLVLEPKETIELRFVLNDQIRELAIASLTSMKSEVISAFENPEPDTPELSYESMSELMEGYFSVYELLIRDLDQLEFTMSVSDTALNNSLSLIPVEGSQSAVLLASQDVNISDLSTSARWDSDIAILMGLSAFPDELQPSFQKLMESIMPFYGLSKDAAAEWVSVTNMSLPFKGVYNLDFNEGFSYSGFYDILENPASEVYEAWLSLCESFNMGDASAGSIYSDVTIKRNDHKHDGHSVDLLELTINPESPLMQLPEQEAIMGQMFKDGKLTYEMSLVDNRIYVAKGGGLERAMEEVSSTAPIEFSENTRVAGSINIISIIQMAQELVGEDAEIDFSTLDKTGTELLFSVETSNALTLRSAVPLKLIQSAQQF